MPRGGRGGYNGGRGGGTKPRYVWAGIQIGTTTDVPTGGVAAVLVPTTFTDEHGGVLVERVRGVVHIFNDDTDSANGAVNIATKVIAVHTNDAGAISDDVQAFDSDAEDIAQRILSQNMHRLGAAAAADFMQTEVVIDIDIKVRIRLEPTKNELVLLLDASVANRARFLCNVRALCRTN